MTTAALRLINLNPALSRARLAAVSESCHAMKITGPGPLVPASARRTSRSAGDAGESFAAQLPSGEAAPAALAGGAPISGVQALLALQEVPDALQSRKRVVKRGNDLLDRLDDIRTGLLLGTIPLGTLKDLAHQLREQRSRDIDGNLSTIMDEIELRVAVELAKLGH